MRRAGILALTWAAHNPQIEHLAECMGATIHCLDILWLKRRIFLPLRYGLLWLWTWRLLLVRRPSCVVVTNTPAFAPLCVACYCLATRTPFVLDVHGHSLGYQWAWAVPLQRLLARKAITNIVDQNLHRQLFEDWGAAITLLERAPVSGGSPAASPARPGTGPFTITVINTFAGDEPLDVLLAAARQLPEVQLRILGDTARAPSALIEGAPPNVTFTGYLRDDAFWGLLRASNAVMTLTTTRYSLVSGGVETMALARPAILSRQPALTAYFTKGTVFVDHTADSMAAGIRQAMAQEQQLAGEMTELLAEKRARWEAVFQEFMQLVRAHVGEGRRSAG